MESSEAIEEARARMALLRSGTRRLPRGKKVENGGEEDWCGGVGRELSRMSISSAEERGRYLAMAGKEGGEDKERGERKKGGCCKGRQVVIEMDCYSCCRPPAVRNDRQGAVGLAGAHAQAAQPSLKTRSKNVSLIHLSSPPALLLLCEQASRMQQYILSQLSPSVSCTVLKLLGCSRGDGC